MNNNKGLLGPINTHYEGRTIKLEDIKEPKLFREIFPFTEVCKTTFDNRIIPISPSKNIYISILSLTSIPLFSQENCRQP